MTYMSARGQRTAVVTDSTSDIPEQTARALDIDVVPALLTVEGKTYRDGIDLTRDEFYRRLPQFKTPPTTAAPSPLAYEEVYERRLSSGYDQILSIHLSAKLSGMINVVNRAAQNFDGRVHIYDSQQVSLGLGFQVIEAAQAVSEGMPMPTLLQKMDETRSKIHLIAMLDTQDYLLRSGRVRWATANLGKMLRIRLLVGVEKGEVVRKALVRTRNRAIEELSALARSWKALQRLAILHTAAEKEAEALAEALVEISTTPPMIVDATTLLGVYVGPAALGIAGLCI